MVELLAIKDGTHYIRWQDDIFTTCALAQASVYPLEQEEKALALLQQARQQGLALAGLVKLTIHEEPYYLPEMR